jgi:RNA polymerase sigma-70 factor (ECF subfamily)
MSSRWEDSLEQAILVKAREGDSRAFAELVGAYSRDAFRIAFGLVGNEEDARDMVQEAFLKALRHIHRFDVSRPFFPWFYSILRNLCFNLIAKRGRHGECALVCESDGGIDPVGRETDPFQNLVGSERAEYIWRALGRLGEDHREIIILRHFQDLSYREIADLLDIPRGTVMSRLYYARGALRQALEEELRDETASLAAGSEVT